ncbi:ATP-dependent RNA helicase RhlB [Firmicutes bacterium ASF500]|nr:ATP-dependent RNA helicase RhlB [Firmicutes bacterium ASF500]
MFDPIRAAREIKASYIDYITTTFDLADPDYAKALRRELQGEGMVAKGPYLDIGGSYETGATLSELMARGKASPLFQALEPVAEKDRELKLDRPLYSHQERALELASAGENLVVTTGTGSGKTESFLLPILDALLREEAAGTLSPGVRAILIYPMNALANDQMKRLRALLRGHPAITFGLYNGNTEHTQTKALEAYRRTLQDDPHPNEIISREEMQRTPPHILITNYSMLEYMMLRPKDDAVFSGAKLRYIVLDEAHIYKGATGMETSLLMRRLRARISQPDSVQYILTSATLGGPEADGDILTFARGLCDVAFKGSGIIRSREKRPPMTEQRDFPPELFRELNQSPEETGAILKKYEADFSPEGDVGEKLYALFLRARLFAQLREAANQPVTVAQLRQALDITEEQVVDLVALCARAEKDGASLIKPRYHFFVRALEGAYVTLTSPKRLYLQRKLADPETGKTVFEGAVCTDCGRLAVVGRTEGGYLRHTARKGGETNAEFYCLREDADGELLEDPEDEEERSQDGTEDYVLCPECGAIAPQADSRFQRPCEHDPAGYVKVRHVVLTKQGTARCPACGFGSFRRFYLGAEAATAVLGTQLFEQLPSEEIVVTETAPAPGRRNIFAPVPQRRQIRKKTARQFLCFSDSRSEAAFFATYMERSYQEFLRRRGLWHVAAQFRSQGRSSVGMAEFVDELARWFEDKRCFVQWDAAEDQETGSLTAVSRRNAWIAVLNEMFNARRSTSLVSMGVLYFEYSKNDDAVQGFQEGFGLEPGDARALLELLAQDALFTGAVNTRAVKLNEAEREYIFYSSAQKKLVKVRTASEAKKSWLSGWQGRTRPNGTFYPNSRMTRLVRALDLPEQEADDLLGDYWDGVFRPEMEEFALDAGDFRVRIGGTEGTAFYRCKKCGRVTPFSVKGQCASVKCGGKLEPFDPLAANRDNHYARLYSSDQADPLFIKEHTAQLAKDQQTRYQEAFVHKKINALSCSTTFEMGVDVGSLETVYLRDVPPSPANYVQRAGRAGRARHSAAFVLTYSKLSSHDFTYYQDPAAMITGRIKVPVFELENEKILNRHVFAVALSAFFARFPEVYGGDDQTILLNEGGYETLKTYLEGKPEDLRQLLLRSIPARMHQRLGLEDWSWKQRLCGPDGVLELAVQDFQGTVAEIEKTIAACKRAGELEEAGKWSRNLRNFRCAKDDKSGKKSLISFLVRNNVLPKYGFPVDTVELVPDVAAMGRDKSLQLARDLQMAIAEYAPGAQVVADGKMYTSRYIRRMPGKNGDSSWEKGYYCYQCPHCGQPNFTKEPVTRAGRECVSCHQIIKRTFWQRTLEPRFGFCAEKGAVEAPLSRPQHDYKTDDYYIGDPQRNLICKLDFQVNGQRLEVESTSNDSLVVIGQNEYKVCAVCGYAVDSKKGEIPLKHENMRGYPCLNKEGKGMEYRLSHDFKTDVAKLTFVTAEAGNYDTMLSVLYALLEGLSQEMGIERTDIKGCLFRTAAEGTIVYSVILYDAVAGGAGHVRRIATEDGKALQSVLKQALSIVAHCDCDSSCYHCLRNYYNQKIHDNLDRKKATAFLEQWIGQMERAELEKAVLAEV